MFHHRDAVSRTYIRLNKDLQDDVLSSELDLLPPSACRSLIHPVRVSLVDKNGRPVLV